MRFPTLATVATAAATLSAAQDAPISGYYQLLVKTPVEGLTGLIWNNLMFAGGVYIGNIKYDSVSQPLVLSGGPGYQSFTSIHAAPTGWQNPYIFPNESKPLGFTQPHSGYFPPGSTAGVWTQHKVNGTGYLGISVGKDAPVQRKWAACEVEGKNGTWQIYWMGGGGLEECVDVELTVFEGGCTMGGLPSKRC